MCIFGLRPACLMRTRSPFLKVTVVWYLRPDRALFEQVDDVNLHERGVLSTGSVFLKPIHHRSAPECTASVPHPQYPSTTQG